MTQLTTSILLAAHAMECPFCGGTDPELIDLETTFWVSCKTCSANGPSGESDEQALERWNNGLSGDSEQPAVDRRNWTEPNGA